jgi:hypothetical protein
VDPAPLDVISIFYLHNNIEHFGSQQGSYTFGREGKNRTFYSLLYQGYRSLTISTTVHDPVFFSN